MSISIFSRRFIYRLSSRPTSNKLILNWAAFSSDSFEKMEEQLHENMDALDKIAKLVNRGIIEPEEVDEAMAKEDGEDVGDGPITPEFEDIFSRDNPPKLDHTHYGLVRKFIGPGKAKVSGKTLRALMYPAEEVKQKYGNKKSAFNPLVWDEETWKNYIQSGNDLFPIDPLYDFTPMSEKYEFSIKPKDLSNLDQFPKYEEPRKPKPGSQCRFCRADYSPTRVNQIIYTNVDLLNQFVNERGAITNRATNKNCAKHQRRIARAIKQARRIALISPISKWKAGMFKSFSEDHYLNLGERLDKLATSVGVQLSELSPMTLEHILEKADKEQLKKFAKEMNHVKITAADNDDIREEFEQKMGSWDGSKGFNVKKEDFIDPAEMPENKSKFTEDVVEEARKLEKQPRVRKRVSLRSALHQPRPVPPSSIDHVTESRATDRP